MLAIGARRDGGKRGAGLVAFLHQPGKIAGAFGLRRIGHGLAHLGQIGASDARGIGLALCILARGGNHAARPLYRSPAPLHLVRFAAFGRPFEPDPGTLPFATDFGNITQRVPAALIGIGRPEGWSFHTDEGAEQFASDWYHVNISHASALMVMSPSGKGPKAEIANTPGRQYTDPLGHGAGFPTHPRSRFDDSVVHGYYDYERLRARLGDARVEGPMTTGHATVFPNFSYLPVNGSIRVWHPKGPDRMEVWAWTLVDASMPDEVKQAQRLYNTRTFGPTGIFEQDDGENWSEVQATARGFMSARLTLNYQMGLGLDGEDGVHPGTTGRLYSDGAARGFYTRWRDLMNTPAWHERPHDPQETR